MATVLLATAAPALADDKAACLDAAAKGQALRDAHKLAEARDPFRLCARRPCSAAVRRECGAWLAEVQRALPSVVITAKDGNGADVESVQVSVDGQPLLTTLDGQAVAMNPGPHLFHFLAADGTEIDQRAQIKSGQKNQAVAVVLAKPVATSPPSPAAVHLGPQETEGAVAPQGGASPWKTVGWVLGGMGVVGIGVGAVFGMKALGDKNAHCNSDNVCDQGSLSGLKTAGLLSDVGLMAGVALVASGTALILFAPSGGHESAAALRIFPIWTATGGQIAAEGSW
jgi:hypothetical protein